ncbi:MAG TPA: GNAT family N-acetyltransferase [Gemmatimonadales bacterium]|nr:GNAT family N-acetyltransferase [Gemmatimonadales bacterium]
MTQRPAVRVRPTRHEDFPGIIALCRATYPESPPWGEEQLASHLEVFPEGQLVALDQRSGEIVGTAASLIVLWDDYDIDMNWRDMTDHGMFTNHDPEGHTLYGAEIMVHPDRRRMGIGRALYAARRDLARRLRLLRIRAGARLRGYGKYAARMSAEEYVLQVIERRLTDPTLTFQLRERFRVLAVVSGYLQHDPESLGHAAVIEWLNHDVARPKHYARRNRMFLRRRAVH